MSLKLYEALNINKLKTSLILNRFFSASYCCLNDKKNDSSQGNNGSSSSSSSSSDSSDDEKSSRQLQKKNPNLNKYKMSFTTLKTQTTLRLAKPAGKLNMKSNENKDDLQQEAEKVAKLLDFKKQDQITKELMEPLKQRVVEKSDVKTESTTINTKTIENLFNNVNEMLNKNKREVKQVQSEEKKQDVEEKTTKKDNLLDFDSFIIDSLKKMNVKIEKDASIDQKTIEFLNVDDKQVDQKRKFETIDNSKLLLEKIEPLGIFTSFDFKPSVNQPQESGLWRAYREERLKEVSYMPPLNAFEEAINLTNEGKLWEFPINNEYKINDEDYKMPFYEHVLLDHYMDEFPQIEAIQKFMRLVLNGLSKNAFMSVAEKQETIYWYKNYFNKKMDVINEALRLEQIENEDLRGVKSI